MVDAGTCEPIVGHEPRRPDPIARFGKRDDPYCPVPRRETGGRLHERVEGARGDGASQIDLHLQLDAGGVRARARHEEGLAPVANDTRSRGGWGGHLEIAVLQGPSPRAGRAR